MKQRPPNQHAELVKQSHGRAGKDRLIKTIRERAENKLVERKTVCSRCNCDVYPADDAVFINLGEWAGCTLCFNCAEELAG